MGKLSLADRATIANMSPEYGATMGFFPVDHVTLDYLKLTGRSDEAVCFLACNFFLLLLRWYFVANIIMKFLSRDVDSSFSSWLCSLGTVSYLFLKVTC